MPAELFYLLGFVGVCILTIILQAVFANLSHSPAELLGPRDSFEPTNVRLLRSRRAMQNSIEAMVMFAPLALMTAATEKTTVGTETSAAVFLAARLVFLPSYVLGIPYLRSLAWVVGFVATVVFFFQILLFSGAA